MWFVTVAESFTPSAPRFKGSAQGVTWAVPALGCDDCKAERAEGRTGRIAQAFDKGMAPASYARAVHEFVTEWEVRLIALHNGR